MDFAVSVYVWQVTNESENIIVIENGIREISSSLSKDNVRARKYMD